MKNVEMSDAEYEHIVTTLEGAIEEFEEMESNLEWFVSLSPERLVDCLAIMKRDNE